MNIVTLSGWAQPHDALQHIIPNATSIDYGNNADPDFPDAYLTEALTGVDIAIGWSLGGILLMHAISRELCSLNKLILVGSLAQFVRDEGFPHGMDTTTFDLFYDNYAANPTRTAKRFAGLIAKGDSKEKDIIGQLSGSDDADKWQPWLDVLDEQKAYYDFDAFPETLIIHGQQDAIVSHKQAEWLEQQIPNATLHSLSHAGHAPHLHDPKRCASIIADFINL